MYDELKDKNQLVKQTIRLQYKNIINDRFNKLKQFQIQKNECIVFKLGEENGIIHSEPLTNESRLLFSFVPLTHNEYKEFRKYDPKYSIK